MDTSVGVLREISQIMGSSLELKWVFDRVMRVLATQMGIQLGRLVIHDDVTGQLRIEAAHNLSPEEQRRGIYAIGEGITGRVFATGQPRVVADVRNDPDYLDRTASRKGSDKPYSFICLPILSESRPIGVLSVDKLFIDQPTLERDFEVLTVTAAMISQAVRINRMVHREKEELIDELAELRKTLKDRYHFSNIVGSSPPMMEVFRTIDQVARTRATVLLMGETGSGKEMIAKAIHYNSERKEKPFIRVNCGALSGHLLESELFGHVKGAFTGAIRDKIGRFEAAHGGTLFLDEVATLDTALQVKLLRVLQEREFERVGDHRTMTADVRIIAAANVDLDEEVKTRRFREDLFYRLNVVAIRLPPLRERRDDIPQLIDHFLDKYNAENGRNLRKISRDLLNLLTRYPWPGNVRELENAIERAVVLSRDESFTEDLLPLAVRAFAEQSRPTLHHDSVDELVRRLVRQAMDDVGGEPGAVWDRVTSRMERALIDEALQRCDGVKLKAADYLGINRNTLNKKYHELGLDVPAPAEPGEQPAPSYYIPEGAKFRPNT
ncbi:MAG: sigma-54-dependent Fis family transcriptional regulator [Phycisphaerae bacterium]